MLDTIPYADLLAIHNALSEKPARRFDTRTNGEKRTAALMEQRGLTLEEAARLAQVVLPEPGGADGSTPREPAAELDEHILLNEGEDESALPPTPGAEDAVTVTVNAYIAPQVKAFSVALSKPERPAWLTTFLRRFSGEGRRSAAAGSRDRQMTVSQRKIVELCGRPDGATGKELAEGCGWPSIAARATCQKIADRFGYNLHESPKANGRGISFCLTAKPAVEKAARRPDPRLPPTSAFTGVQYDRDPRCHRRLLGC